MSDDDDEINIPQDYLCPISQEIMTDPVMAADGQTYDRESITNWLSRKTGRSPLDGSNLSHTNLTDNLFARKIIKEFQRTLPEQRDVRTKLEKCIQQKEEMIKNLLNKINQININHSKATTDAIIDLKKENATLKKQIIQLEEKNLQLGEKNMQQEEVIHDLKKENAALKKEEIKIQPKELPSKNYIPTDIININKRPSYRLHGQPRGIFVVKKDEINIQPIGLPNKKFTSYNFEKSYSYKLDQTPLGILELSEGEISCWTEEKIELLKCNTNSLELSKSLPLKTQQNYTYPIEQENGDIIYRRGPYELTICDKNFNLIEIFKESNSIWSLCGISKLSFAVGLSVGTIKIYSRNSNSQKYEVIKEYNFHSNRIWSLLYLPKQNYLLSGSSDQTINVLSLSEEKSIKKLTGHNSTVSSLISLNDETFASGSYREIKIWSIKANIICLKNIRAHEEVCEFFIFLQLVENDFIVSQSGDEFKIWDLKNYQCSKTYKENSGITAMIVTKNKNIITGTGDNKVNLWQISN
jgi:hypothetical protein